MINFLYYSTKSPLPRYAPPSPRFRRGKTKKKAGGAVGILRSQASSPGFADYNLIITLLLKMSTNKKAAGFDTRGLRPTHRPLLRVGFHSRNPGSE